ncbi:unnamed protein product [Mytilus coruscus]|uniref:Reverse transcriptase/retrotransposon-derived protein RNase H-like domain-containing protein n=1 Tax=Mytilus coruscus TaxID=42192 RepID=A0A6J8C7Q7_MYTCO|nr:unnamed protein product [Mytilus coruscus]
MEWPVPQNVTELRSFLGLCGYYRRYIRNFSDTAKSLHQMTEKGREFLWTNDSHEAFEKLKGKLVSAAVLSHPDFSQTFILDTDASNRAIGGVLSQVIDGEKHVIAYGSRTLSEIERREDPETNLKQVVIPMKDRRNSFEFAHDNRTAAHLGIKRTLARIKESFYWTGVRDQNMVNTKTTPAKSSQETYRCSVCGDKFPTSKEWRDHIVKCCEEKRVSTFVCKEPVCTKHLKSAITVPESDSNSEENQFSQAPPVSSCMNVKSAILEVPSSPEIPPVRKPTKPLPVFGSAKKRQLMERLADGVRPVKVLRTTATAGGGVFRQPTCGLFAPARRTIETQTPEVMEISSDMVAHHHVKKPVRLWYEEGVKVEETTEETWDD